MNANNEIFYGNLKKTKYYDFEGIEKKKLEVEFKTNKTTFKNCSELEIIDYLLKDKVDKENLLEHLSHKIEELSKIKKEQISVGFFTLSNSVAEVWDNEEEDDWDKHL